MVQLNASPTTTLQASAQSMTRDGWRAVRHIAIPLTLLLWAPPMMMITWYTHVHLDGSLWAMGQRMLEQGVLTTVVEVWGPVFLGSSTAWTMLGIYAVTQAILMRVLPGRRYEGPITKSGHVPVYTANGVAAFVVTMAAYCTLSFGLGVFSPTIIYDHFGEMLGALNIFSLFFCLVLYFKGRFAPSPGEHGVTGNPIFDYYWGTELYPRVLGWDIKMFTNCRLAMMGWPLIVVSFAAAQAQRHGLTDAMFVAAALQLIYIAKFFWWEDGYMRSLDIMHDRAGFYIVWGVLVWLPCVYTGGTLYLVNHPHSLGYVWSAILLVVGTAGIFINYFADAQRKRVRETQGRCTVWGKEPRLVVGHYVTEKGEAKESLLLASGWWGIARHFHYVPELVAAYCWTAPVLFDHLLPWFYAIFLTILLVDRAFRDDKRCAEKYGADWDTYRRLVPYKILPGIL